MNFCIAPKRPKGGGGPPINIPGAGGIPPIGGGGGGVAPIIGGGGGGGAPIIGGGGGIPTLETGLVVSEVALTSICYVILLPKLAFLSLLIWTTVLNILVQAVIHSLFIFANCFLSICIRIILG